MNVLQEHMLGYLETLGFSFLEKTKDFVVADKVDFGGARDTRLIWTPLEPEHEWDISHIERRLLWEFRDKTKQYPNARGWVVAYTFGGYSQEFRAEARRYNILLRVPIQFFDASFKYEEAPQYQSAIKDLRNPPPRIPQPYSIIVNGKAEGGGDDLLEALWNEFRFSEEPSLRIVVGPAGIGKTWLFRALFSRLYRHFLDQKNRQESFPRPIPLIPSYLKKASTLRTRELLRSFIESEIASPVRQSTFKWLVTHGYAIWLFDGLDELYAEDPDFFHDLADILTHPAEPNQAHMLVCARESLLTSCEPFAEFINDYIEYGEDPTIRIYRLEGWERRSKRAFAQLLFDPPQDSQFVSYISRTESLRSLSKLPYYCDLLGKAFVQGKLEEFIDDFSLLNYAVTEIIEREKGKGLLRPEDFQPNGFNEWLETVASEFFTTGFKGVSRLDVETYAKLVLVPGLSETEQQNAITSLIQFPLFAPGVEPGVIAFEHELIAEYLAGRYWFERLLEDPRRVAGQLGDHSDFTESLIARYMALQISKRPDNIQGIKNTLRLDPPSGRAFTNLLQLLLMASSARDVLSPLADVMDGHDLSQVCFDNRELEGFSFRNCNLSNTVFRACNLRHSRFEGARLSGTRFEKIKRGDLEGTQFGDLFHFEFVYIDKKRIEDRAVFVEWAREMTGEVEQIVEPCPSAIQLRTLFLKFVRPDGTGRRDDLPLRALIRGKRHPKAPDPEDFVKACVSFGYLQDTRWHERVRRVPGDRYNEMVHFVKDWKLTKNLSEMLDILCDREMCEHVPELH